MNIIDGLVKIKANPELKLEWLLSTISWNGKNYVWGDGSIVTFTNTECSVVPNLPKSLSLGDALVAVMTFGSGVEAVPKGKGSLESAWAFYYTGEKLVFRDGKKFYVGVSNRDCKYDIVTRRPF
jgi:hypothetical protein